MMEDDSVRFVRDLANDRRISRGDDFAGDAWVDQVTQQVVYGVVGHDMNADRASRARTPCVT